MLDGGAVVLPVLEMARRGTQEEFITEALRARPARLFQISGKLPSLQLP